MIGQKFRRGQKFRFDTGRGILGKQDCPCLSSSATDTRDATDCNRTFFALENSFCPRLK